MLRKISAPKLLLTIARTASAIGASSAGASTGGICASEITRSPIFTAKSPIRSRSFVIFSVATTRRMSSAGSWFKCNRYTAWSSMTISMSLMCGSTMRISLAS